MCPEEYPPEGKWGPGDDLSSDALFRATAVMRAFWFGITQGLALMTKTLWLASTAIVAAAMITAPAYAGGKSKDDARDQEIQELRARLDRLERESEDEKIVSGSRIGKVEEHQAAQPVWSYANNRPTISSPDGKNTMTIRGRAQLDFASFEQDPSDMGTSFNCNVDSLCDLGAGTVFRRVRFGVEGKFFSNFVYELRFDFGGSNAEPAGTINIARVGYTGIPNLRIQAGALQPMFTLYDATSSADLNTMERAAVITTIVGAFGGDSARKGVEATYMKSGFFYPGDNLIMSAAFTGARIGTSHAGNPDDEGTQILGRVAYRLYSDSDTNIQIGASGADILSLSGTTPGGARNLSFSSTPEIRVNGNTFVSTGSIRAEGGSLYGFEAAANFKNFFLSAEYYQWEVERDNTTNPGPDPEFDGFYVEGTWILTGEKKSYKGSATNNNAGVWASPTPKNPFSPDGGGWGAWELTARYSFLDLNSNENLTTANGGFAGGEQEIITLGVNWFLNTNLKLMAEYAMVDVERQSAAGVANNGLGAEFDIIQGRMQFSF
jgi:phosphate-selective porin OprO/OprP